MRQYMPCDSPMTQVLWKFVVKAAHVSRFEQAYGPGGDWERLFARYPGYLGTTLLRDPDRPNTYVTIDAWDAREQRDAMLADARADYEALDARCDGWTDSESELGTFDIVSPL